MNRWFYGEHSFEKCDLLIDRYDKLGHLRGQPVYQKALDAYNKLKKSKNEWFGLPQLWQHWNSWSEVYDHRNKLLDAITPLEEVIIDILGDEAAQHFPSTGQLRNFMIFLVVATLFVTAGVTFLPLALPFFLIAIPVNFFGYYHASEDIAKDVDSIFNAKYETTFSDKLRKILTPYDTYMSYKEAGRPWIGPVIWETIKFTFNPFFFLLFLMPTPGFWVTFFLIFNPVNILAFIIAVPWLSTSSLADWGEPDTENASAPQDLASKILKYSIVAVGAVFLGLYIWHLPLSMFMTLGFGAMLGMTFYSVAIKGESSTAKQAIIPFFAAFFAVIFFTFEVFSVGSLFILVPLVVMTAMMDWGKKPVDEKGEIIKSDTGPKITKTFFALGAAMSRFYFHLFRVFIQFPFKFFNWLFTKSPFLGWGISKLLNLDAEPHRNPVVERTSQDSSRVDLSVEPTGADLEITRTAPDLEITRTEAELEVFPTAGPSSSAAAAAALSSTGDDDLLLGDVAGDAAAAAALARAEAPPRYTAASAAAAARARAAATFDAEPAAPRAASSHSKLSW